MTLSVDIGAKVEPRMVEQLDAAARVQRRTRAEIIRFAIEDYLDKQLSEAERQDAGV